LKAIIRREEGKLQFSKSTDYALHAVIHLAYSERCNNVGVKELSGALGVSESYLSKIMSKLRQNGIVRAVPGVKGGYELARPVDQITFLDVIQVVKGRQQLFEGSNSSSRQHLEKVMNGAEQHLHQYLREHTIQTVLETLFKRCDSEVNKK